MAPSLALPTNDDWRVIITGFTGLEVQAAQRLHNWFLYRAFVTYCVCLPAPPATSPTAAPPAPPAPALPPIQTSSGSSAITACGQNLSSGGAVWVSPALAGPLATITVTYQGFTYNGQATSGNDWVGSEWIATKNPPALGGSISTAGQPSTPLDWTKPTATLQMPSGDAGPWYLVLAQSSNPMPQDCVTFTYTATTAGIPPAPGCPTAGSFQDLQNYLCTLKSELDAIGLVVSWILRRVGQPVTAPPAPPAPLPPGQTSAAPTSAVALLITLTVSANFPSSLDVPTTYYGLGFYTLITANGPMAPRRLWLATTVVEPLPADVTGVYLNLDPTVGGQVQWITAAP